MSLAAKLTCPICHNKFVPTVNWQVCDTLKCANVHRVRRWRQRKRFGGDDGGPPGGGQRDLFPRHIAAKAKAPKPVAVPEPTLFEADMLASFGGVEHFLENAESGEKSGLRLIRRRSGIM